MANYHDYALICARRAFVKTWRAYLARPEVLTAAHDEQVYRLARMLGHLAIVRDRTLAPGEPIRY